MPCTGQTLRTKQGNSKGLLIRESESRAPIRCTNTTMDLRRREQFRLSVLLTLHEENLRQCPPRLVHEVVLVAALDRHTGRPAGGAVWHY